MPMSDDTPNPARNYIEVARQGESVLFRVIGLGNMNISLILCEFAEAAHIAGKSHFVVDLHACTGMDSTFMGTLVGMAERARKGGGWLCLVNVSANQEKLLRQIGVWGLVPMRETFSIDDAVEVETLLPGGDPAKRMAHIRRAHQKLVEIDERNHERFGAFLAALDSEMDTPPEKPEGSD